MAQSRMQPRRQIRNPISISDMRDAVVDEGTYSKYVNDIIPFLRLASCGGTNLADSLLLQAI